MEYRYPKSFQKKKRVDITLATDMLIHASKKNYDIALLIAGDEDYVPLVNAVQSEGCRVIIWFFSNGMSRALRMAADKYVDISNYMISNEYHLF